MKSFDDFNRLITDINFDFLGTSESRIFKYQSLNIKISLLNYLIEKTPTELISRKVALYINKACFDHLHADLMVYKTKKIVCTFIEALLSKEINLINGCIYRHPCIDIYSFNEHYLNPFLEKLSKNANKIIVLLHDFFTDLLNYDTSDQIKNFLDDLASNSLQPQILQPTSS